MSCKKKETIKIQKKQIMNKKIFLKYGIKFAIIIV